MSCTNAPDDVEATRAKAFNDVTNGRVKFFRADGTPLPSTYVYTQDPAVPTRWRYRLEPYLWPCIQDTPPSAPIRVTMTHALVRHKCHFSECSSTLPLRAGQYVAIEADRGMDIGVVVRVSRLSNTAPSPALRTLRYATQGEVDFWATDLKALEASALENCRQRVLRHRLPMDVRLAEYQYDQKKLTFYYDARQRVDFVQLLRELFHEFGCRIWMEKIQGPAAQ